MTQEQLEKDYDIRKKRIIRLGFICSGSVMLLYRKCGKATCACQDNKKAEHGPYYIWTRKVNGKTVTRTLSEQQANQCQKYIENLKNLNAILEEMKNLTAQIIESK